MLVACLDLEGVLVPEIWINVAERTGIDELRLTTRDIADYDELMTHRLRVLDAHGVRLSQIQEVIASLGPLPGAAAFLDWLRERFQVVILSDTFYQFGMPLMAQLGHPTLLCHRLEVADDRIVGYRLRQPDGKTAAVRAFQSLNFQVVATGLATTGGEIQGGWIALAALLLMLGLGMTRIARSTRPIVQTE